MKACHVIPSQYINVGTLINKRNSLIETSVGVRSKSLSEKPNIMFIQERKKKVGPIKYKNTSSNKVHDGNKSKKNEKKRNSEIKKIDPGNPKNIKIFNKTNKNNFGHR